MIALHGEVHETEAAASPPAREGPAEGAEAAPAAKVPHLRQHPQRGVDGEARRQLVAAVMGDARPALAARIPSSAAASPLAQRERELANGVWSGALHLNWADIITDPARLQV